MAEPTMTMSQWVKRLTFYEILVGMRATLSVFVHRIILRNRRAVTLQYPHEKRDLPGTYRGMIALLRYDDLSEKCVGCDLCEAACPSRVITVISAEKEGEPMKRYAKEYSMDMTRCIFCGLCVKACPVDALAMTTEYEWAVYNKRDLLLNKQQLLALGDRNFPEREKKIELQHHSVTFFNIGHQDLPVMTSQEPPVTP
jgi:NADH-quinone oxidoreductase subunit I